MRPALRLLAGTTALCLLLPACSGDPEPPRSQRGETASTSTGVRAGPARLEVQEPRSHVTVLTDDGPAGLSLATSRLLLTHAAVAVVASDDAQDQAGRLALRLRAPVLVVGGDDDAVRGELDRLGVRRVVGVGTAAEPFGTDDRVVVGQRAAAANAPAERPLTGTAVVGRTEKPAVAAQATARIAGLTVQTVRSGDPRRDRATRAALGPPSSRVVVLGGAFGSASDAAYTVAAAQRGLELPGGGQTVFPGRRMVALYGVPETPSLGVLGEQSLARTVQRARRTARPYAAIADKPVIPTFELIATVASASQGDDGNYSNEADPATLRPWLAAARRAGMYVVLDLQPGRSSFLSQAKRYRRLLTQPNVGLALDPEWRLEPGGRPLERIGSVDVAEVNALTRWLASLTRTHALPQKLVVLHQFQQQMISGRARLVMSHPELALLIHADGQGAQGAKRGTWTALRRGAPRGVYWGWKNFYDEDEPTLSPRQTYAVRPRPDFVSYQ